MQNTGNTMLITGGGSGIGRALAEAFQRQGNQVIIAGRRWQALEEVTHANPGMRSLLLDVENADGMREFCARLERDFPTLNVLVNNAGIMRPERFQAEAPATADAAAMVTTNLLGPIRLTAALLPLLRRQPRCTVMNVTSGLAFVPLAITPTYCATKAALHSFTESLREQFQGTNVEIIELAPPYVQTELTGQHQATDPRAMPLAEFVAEVMQILSQQPTPHEVIVERCKPLRFAAETGTYATVFQHLNAAFTEH